MAHSSDNPFRAAVADVKVVQACLSTDTLVTEAVVDGVWRWFADVEIVLPLPIMGMKPQERDSIAKMIADDMLASFERAADLWDQTDGSQNPEEVAPQEIRTLNALWREFAGCYAELVNAQVPTVTMSDEESARFYDSFVSRTAEALGVSEEETREALRTDSAFRMMIRLQGFDPDQAR